MVLAAAFALMLAATVPPGLVENTLRLLGRFGGGHACPISATRAWTSAHVTDLVPFISDHQAYPFPWSDGRDGSGFLYPVDVERARDLATMQAHARTPFHAWLDVAQDAPKPGDPVWLVGYEWDKGRKNTLAPKVIDARVLRVVAGHFTFSQPGEPGSSGSCVVNERGQVVGINSGSIGPATPGLAVGVWGAWGKFSTEDFR